MIANGILFKAEFDMSLHTEKEILRQYNPAKFSTIEEDIQATPNVQVTKITTTSEDFKFIGYKSKDTFILEQILESSKYMEMAAPRLLRVIEISSEYFLVAYPHYSISCESCPDFQTCDEMGCMSEEDEDKVELNEKIEDTIKELARVTIFFVHEHSDPKIIQDNINSYVSLCFKFTEPEERLVSMDEIAQDLEDKLKTLCQEEKKKKGKDSDNDKN